MKLWAEIGALKLSLYLKDKVQPELFEKYSSFLIPQATQKLLSECMKEREEQCSGGFQKLFAECKENLIALTCMELAFLEYMMPFSNHVLDCVTCYHTNGVTIELAAKIALGHPDISGAAGKMAEAFQIVRRILVSETEPPNPLYQEFHVDLQLSTFLEDCRFFYLGTEGLNYSYFSKSEQLPRSILYESQFSQMADRIFQMLRQTHTKKEIPVVVISGDKNSGRKFAAKHLAVRLGWNLFLLHSTSTLLEQEKLNEQLGRFYRDAALFEGCICICEIEEFEKKPECLEKLCRQILKFFPDRPLFLTAGKKTVLPQTLKNLVLQITIPDCQTGERLQLWDEFSSVYLKKPVFPYPKAAERMRLNAGQIKQVVKKMQYQKPKDWSLHDVMSDCYKVLDRTSRESANSMLYAYGWEDLKVPAETKQLLNNICMQVEHRKMLFEDWGLKQIYAYGNCVSALFSGPPGTGKTMAAHVIANRLNMEIFQVNLSQIMDKYIGETEKRLEESFQKAEQTSRILFFDEADVLFGRRSEIQDAKDRYANNEVAYILQRLENYQGVVLLATNLLKNIDVAFIRRLRYIVNFPMPDAVCRKEIWNALFSGKLPHKEVDFNFLAERFELSGAVIKNVVWNAAVLAVEEGYVTMKHLVQSLALEYRKMGQLVIREEFGEYADYL